MFWFIRRLKISKKLKINTTYGMGQINISSESLYKYISRHIFVICGISKPVIVIIVKSKSCGIFDQAKNRGREYNRTILK